jgi:hypothetical protein
LYDGRFGLYRGPKDKTKIVLTVGDYFKRVRDFSNFSNAVWSLVIPWERSVERSFPFPFLQADRACGSLAHGQTDSQLNIIIAMFVHM